jgi:hypothetical protein
MCQRHQRHQGRPEKSSHGLTEPPSSLSPPVAASRPALGLGVGATPATDGIILHMPTVIWQPPQGCWGAWETLDAERIQGGGAWPYGKISQSLTISHAERSRLVCSG